LWLLTRLNQESQRFEQLAQQVTLEDYRPVKMRGVVEALQSLRGVAQISAVSIVAVSYSGSAEAIDKFAVNQNKGDSAVLPGAIRPSVIGASLHDDIACSNGDLANIDEKRNLALKNNSVVDSLSAVHVRMTRLTHIGGRALSANLGEVSARLGNIEIRSLSSLGWDIENSDARATGWRSEDYAILRWFSACSINSRRSFTRIPDFIESRSVTRESLNALRRAIRLDDSSTIFIMSRDNAAKRARHKLS